MATEEKANEYSFGDVIKLVKKQPSGIALLSIDVSGLSNTLSSFVLDCFMQSLEEIKKDPSLKALVLHSPKPDIFITGADIKEIAKFEDENAARSLSSRGHAFLKEVLALDIPTVAAIDGACLGGGLEMVLCLDKRIASKSSSTIFGLPELTLGLLPGLGGTQRLPRLVGYRKAIDLILSGGTIGAREALDIGLVDDLEDSETLLARAEKEALKLASPEEGEFDREKLLTEREARAEEIDGGSSARAKAIKLSKRAIRMRANPAHYPAPGKVIEVIEVGLNEGIEAGILAEIDAFSHLASSETARNMIAFYFQKEMASQTALRATKKFSPPGKIAIVGSGYMGKGIAELALEAGFQIMVRGSNAEKSEAEAIRLKKKFPQYGQDSPDERISPVLELEELVDADMVIETVYENLEIKREVIEEISKYISDRCIFASNTSSIPVSHLGKFARIPENFIGLHFFNPINLMPLIEVISYDQTNKDTYNKTMAFVGKLGKVPVSVNDSPGFVVNRLLTCFITESIRMATRGIPVNWTEAAVKRYGMPYGPYELLDDLGWSLSRAVSECVADNIGERLRLPDEMYLAIAKGYEGKENNKGCYLWEDHSKKIDFNPEFLECLNARVDENEPGPEDLELIINWLFLTMIDEAARCLEEKVVKKPRDIDLALVTGAGYPPFRGGILRQADKIGIENVITNLEKVYTDYKLERDISNLLREMHNIGRKFYSLG